MSQLPIVILASGGGTGFESIADAVQAGRLDAEIRAVICDKPGAGVLARAARRGIRTIVLPFERQKHPSLEEARQAHDERILSELQAVSPRFLVMAGYMRIVSPRLIEAFRGERGYTRIVNIHPSLLPSFPGVGAYAQAFRYGAKMTGTTVHLVEAEVDSGPICAQESFSIAQCRSENEVEELGKKIEHRLYPDTLSWVLPEKFEVEARAGESSRGINVRRLCVRPY